MRASREAGPSEMADGEFPLSAIIVAHAGSGCSDLPHSRQRVWRRGVMSLQKGHTRWGKESGGLDPAKKSLLSQAAGATSKVRILKGRWEKAIFVSGTVSDSPQSESKRNAASQGIQHDVAWSLC